MAGIHNSYALEIVPREKGMKYYSAYEGAVHALYIRGLRVLINMGFDPEGWTPIYEDNNACIEWGNNVIGGLVA